MLLMVFITIFLLVIVLGNLPVFFLSLFQKMFLEHLFRARHICWRVGGMAVNKTNIVSALLGGARKAKSQLRYTCVVRGVIRGVEELNSEEEA